MANAIFISYRRDDSEGEAGRLFDDLTRAFGDDAVFMDVAGIKPGVDFRQAIEDNVASCGVFLAVVGPTWATIANPDGTRRLEDPNDFVALEISSALKREVPVIPVLVHDAKMPAASLLPESLKSFAFHNSVEISHARWASDVDLLIEALKAYVTPKTASEATVHATVPVQLPAPHHPTGTGVPAVAKNSRPALFGILAGIIILIVAVIVYVSNANHTGNQAATPAPASTTSSSSAPPASPTTPSPGPGYVGTWKRTDNARDGDALGELIISSSNSGLAVQAYGTCQAPNCNWGSQPGVISGANLVATFSPSPSGSDTSRTAMVTVHPTQGGLDVLVHNTFQNPSGPRANNSHHLFAAAQ